MILIDIDMPDNCRDCGLLAKFDDDRFGCELILDDNGYGLALITNLCRRHPMCPLKEIHPYVYEVLIDKLDELQEQRRTISDEIEILSNYIHID